MTTATATGSPSTLALILRSLSSRNYRLFFTGQLVSLIGSWLTTTAILWLVSRLTHNDTFILGMVGFAGQIPAFILSPLGGVLVDRLNLHRTLVATQILSMLQSSSLAVLVFLGLPPMTTVYILLGLLALQGFINAFDMPARQSFVVQLVDNPADLPNAIALNSSMFNLARLAGPAVAGVLIAVFGEALCFTIDAASYLAVIASLLMMQIPPRPALAVRKDVVQDFKEGLTYTFSFKPIRYILLLLALVSLVGVPYTILLPLYASQYLHGTSMTYGLLTAATGAGALAGALRLAARKSVLGLGRVIPLATLGFGASLMAFAYSRSLYLSFPLMAVVGFCMVTQMASGNTLLQTIVDHDKRGRVMAFFGMAFQGMMPLGSLIVGVLARPDRLGPSFTLALGGLTCIIAACTFLAYLPKLRSYIRPIYIQRGILPEVATALQETDAAVDNAPES